MNHGWINDMIAPSTMELILREKPKGNRNRGVSKAPFHYWGPFG